MQKKSSNQDFQPGSSHPFSYPIGEIPPQDGFQFDSNAGNEAIWDQPLVLGNDSVGIPININDQNSMGNIPYPFPFFQDMGNYIQESASEQQSKNSRANDAPQYPQKIIQDLNRDFTLNLPSNKPSDYNSNQSSNSYEKSSINYNEFNNYFQGTAFSKDQGNVQQPRPDANNFAVHYTSINNELTKLVPKSNSDFNIPEINKRQSSSKSNTVDMNNIIIHNGNPTSEPQAGSAEVFKYNKIDFDPGSPTDNFNDFDNEADAPSQQDSANNSKTSNSAESVSQRRIARRRERNREAARRSRERRTHYVNNLRKYCEGLERENMLLKMRNTTLERDIEIIRTSGFPPSSRANQNIVKMQNDNINIPPSSAQRPDQINISSHQQQHSSRRDSFPNQRYPQQQPQQGFYSSFTSSHNPDHRNL
ncbi:hypothetical protein AYI68_g1158 [Smittium mucronatum]|uniref:BZIP domain-containing protein n=1 Tax=Smittium mucronatum TaxID=133383 RepID=A0A1R0H6F5_9FUNG|nr:hypothetical protein AYI68_g1158 [Smittium mucronatum]